MFAEEPPAAEQPEAPPPGPSRNADEAAATSPTPAPRCGPEMDSAELSVQLLALGQVKGIGQHTLRRLVDHYGDLRKIWSEDPPILADVLGRARVRDNRTVATTIVARADDLRASGEKQRDALASRGVRVLSIHDSKFPSACAAFLTRPIGCSSRVQSVRWLRSRWSPSSEPARRARWGARPPRGWPGWSWQKD